MRVVVVYRDASDHGRPVIEFLREYTRRTGRQLSTLSPDTADGMNFARLYDIVEYPSVVAVNNNGELLQLWRGLPLPLINEVSYYDEAV